jgi:hypothetical protein
MFSRMRSTRRDLESTKEEDRKDELKSKKDEVGWLINLALDPPFV